MKKIAIVVSVLFAFSAPVLAGPKDKSSQTLIDIDGAGVIDNNLTKTQIKSKGCTLQIKMKPTTGLNDGDVVICIASADIRSAINGGNSVVITGEAKAGQVKIKADLSEVVLAGNSCGSVVTDQFNGSLDCYLDDQTYRTTGVAGNWEDACAGGKGPNLNPDAKTLKTALDGNGDPQKVVVGICQGVVDGFRITPPPTQRFAVTGGRVQIQ